MAIKFDGDEVKGVHGRVLVSPANLQRSLTKYQGINGVSEIFGGQGLRKIRTHIWLMDRDNPYNEQGIMDELNRLAKLAGDFGTLEIFRSNTSPGLAKTFEFCTFIGFTEDDEGAKHDPTGDHGFWAPGWLEWEQLYIGKPAYGGGSGSGSGSYG